jgi:hypothetical protein
VPVQPALIINISVMLLAYVKQKATHACFASPYKMVESGRYWRQFFLKKASDVK